LSPTRWASLLAVCFLSSACDSRLLGPTECEALALRVTQIRSLNQLRDPRVHGLVTGLTNDCLTKPYDHMMGVCVTRVGRLEPCLADLARRTRLH